MLFMVGPGDAIPRFLYKVCRAFDTGGTFKRDGPRSRDVRRDVAFALAAVFVVAAVALLGLSTTGSGGMMDGMMGGSMVWMGLGGALVLLAVVLLVVAVVTPSPSAPTPSPIAPPPAPVAPWAPPAPPPGASPPAASVEAAVVKLLDEDERLLYTRLRDSGGVVLQKDVVAWGTFSAAKVTRLLDRLERKGLVVRERHGMTNRIRLAYR